LRCNSRSEAGPPDDTKAGARRQAPRQRLIMFFD